MSDSTQHERPVTAVGHLSVRIEGEHPEDTPFMFEQVGTRLFGAMGASLVIQVGILVVIVLLAVYYTGATQASDTMAQTVIPPGIIWIPQEGPGGGGGGGGNRMKEPPKKLELPGKDTINVPAEKPKPLQVPKEIKPTEAPPQIAQLDAKSMQLGAIVSPGTFDGVPSGVSQGTGTGNGAGSGTGTGIGPGNGPGIGDGWGGGTGGGAYRPGNGISLPKPIREVKPTYTAEAMRAKIQGTVVVECVVLPDGTVGDVHVVRTLDSSFGLDQEAIKAAKQWRFIPGTRNGQPVPVLISIELSFHLV